MSTRTMQTERVTNKAGEPFRVVCWPSPVPAKAAIVLHHGLGEHAGRYEMLAQGLGDLPVDIWTYDARGHGESVGKRGDADRIEGFARDFDEMLPLLKEKSGHDRVFIYGHSMGGAVVTWWATSRQVPSFVKGFILSAPAITVPRSLAINIKLAVGKVLGRAFPTLTLGSGLAPTGISSDPAEVARYASDPLVHGKISARLGVSLTGEVEDVLMRAGRIQLPSLIFHGDADPIVSVDGTRKLAKGLGTDDVRYEELRGYMHEPHHETKERRERLFAIVREWLLPRL
jgi:alpha-beta hydrolase superfamily lysophospholipase